MLVEPMMAHPSLVQMGSLHARAGSPAATVSGSTSPRSASIRCRSHSTSAALTSAAVVFVFPNAVIEVAASLVEVGASALRAGASAAFSSPPPQAARTRTISNRTAHDDSRAVTGSPRRSCCTAAPTLAAHYRSSATRSDVRRRSWHITLHFSRRANPVERALGSTRRRLCG